MSRLTLLPAVVFAIVFPAMDAAAQEHRQGDEAKQIERRRDTPHEEKRGVSEEGGMKASGPSQAKGGESR